MELDRHITRFVEAVGSGAVEIYNEFSLQHELGVYLRSNLEQCRVQFERNVSHFHLAKSGFEKKEIDIAITYTPSGDPLSAIELKYPRNGQVPESMFSFCKDIAFLEQLVSSGFKSAYFLAVADDRRFTLAAMWGSTDCSAVVNQLLEAFGNRPALRTKR